jgi:hypothetical protein
LESSNFAGPTVGAGFVHTVAQVGDELDESGPSSRIDPQGSGTGYMLTELVKID